ncbi:hypothetical protein F4808DRAFT_455506 [Astrocystis sublimbata]|nr:hypothetical protein F4808DRAFT_455506 [Astrocystis sublimbata]
MPDPEDYTVGWICAVDKEHVAAQAFLDDQHDDLDSLPANDNNTYTLGRVGKHNVVIAVLPHWEYGLVNAANAARDMIRSFPNLRVGLMVGIGGGAPARQDIRLGDVVVSSAGRANGGVFQYDFGKTIQNKAFDTTGFLNKPPTFIMTAVAALKTTYRMKGHQFQETIANVLNRFPRLRDEYQRPAAVTDRLYRSDVIHRVENDEDCATSCGDGESKLIVRSTRSVNHDDPAIHYGLIASSNRLMKDASIRDKLSIEKDVLCFEMEAAGLMNQFPFLIVRGICDYSDTHKNSLWQGYAAITAAAYTRDLLYKIAPNQVKAERRLGEVLQEVRKDVKQVKHGVESLKADAYFDHISNWLSPPDPSTNLNSALNNRHPGSGNGFSPTQHTQAGKQRDTLFCGSMEFPDANLLYFYFDFNDTRKQNLDMMLRSCISQLYNKCENVRNRLDSLYSSCNQGRTQPSLESLRGTFHDMVQQAGEVWIVLDALDECSTRKEHATEGLLSWIQNLRLSQVNVHLLVTSRPEQDIKSAIRSWAQHQDIIPIQSNLIQEDIKAYVHARVREPGELSNRWHTRPDIQAQIEDALIEKADGMFRWASCQLDELEKCFRPPEVRKALANLPKTLDETYARIIANISPEHKHVAIRILQFLTFSKRPLSLEEAVDCIAVNTNTQTFDPEDRNPIPEEISRYCSSLVVIAEREGGYEEANTVTELQLAHFSVKEYLVSDKLAQGIDQDFKITTARASLACTLLHKGADVNAQGGKYSNALQAASYRGHEAIVQTLLHKGADVNAQGGKYGNALQAASSEGYEAIVQTLFYKGADMNAQGGEYSNALQAASYRGHEAIVQTLLHKGADVNAQGGEYSNALQAASYRGHEAIVQTLLHKGADVNAQGGKYSNALQAASYRGHEAIVKMLFDEGAVNPVHHLL